MTIGIIGAMDEEIMYLKAQMKQKKTHDIAGIMLVEGEIAEKAVVLVQSGIGKVNAAMTTTILLERFHPTAIINTGTAGGFSDQLEVSDLVIGKKIVHHDVDVTGFDYKYGQVPGMPLYFEADAALITATNKVLDKLHIHYKAGLIATGDIFMHDPEKIRTVQSLFPELIAMEMEAAAIAQVCYQYEVPFIIIRALSDIAGKDAPMSFDQFVSIASKNASNFIIEMLKEL